MFAVDPGWMASQGKKHFHLDPSLAGWLTINEATSTRNGGEHETKLVRPKKE
jgi:hypothetical protein